MSDDRYNAEDIGAESKPLEEMTTLQQTTIAGAPRARGDIPGLKFIDESPFIETPTQQSLNEALDAPLIGGELGNVQLNGDINMSESELPSQPFELDDAEANALARDAEMAEINGGATVEEDLDISSYGDPDDDVDEGAPHDDDVQDSSEGADAAEAALGDAE